MPRIFISYRRDDSTATVGRIHDRLVKAFGKDNVFMDVDIIPPGSDFAEVLEEELEKCDVLLIIIGQKWVTIADANGHKRLENPEDFVRIEVERGLARHDLLVIPVLVDEALVPNPADLPESLGKIASLQVIQIRHNPDFHRDVDRLIKFLKRTTLQRIQVTIRLLAVIITVILLLFIVNSAFRSNLNSTGTANTQITQTGIAASATNTPSANSSINATSTQLAVQTLTTQNANTTATAIPTLISTLPQTLTMTSEAYKSCIYTVQPGDNLFRVAVIHDVTLDDLRAANPQIKDDIIQPNDILNIPGCVYTSTPTATQSGG